MLVDGGHLTHMAKSAFSFLAVLLFQVEQSFIQHEGNSCLSHSQVMVYNHPAGVKYRIYGDIYLHVCTCLHLFHALLTPMLQSKLIELKIK